MKQILLIGIFGLSQWAMAGGHGHKHADAKKLNADAKTFGGKIGKTSPTTLATLMGEYNKFKGKTVVFEGTPEKVCEKKGCWMVLKDGDKKVRTLFKDYGFFVPANIVGKKVRVQGTMEQKQVSAATIRHFMKDEGKKIDEIKKVKTSQTRFQFTADAVEII